MNYFPTDFSALLVTAALTTAFIAILIKLLRTKQKYILPPGPRGIPLVGNILSFVRKPLHLQLTEWVPQFGNIYTIHIGPKPALVVNDIATMKEIFGIFPASTGKLLTETFIIPFEGQYGIIVAEGKTWAEQRQFCVKNLRTFGFGKGSTMEPMVIEEVNDLIAWFQKEGAGNKPVLVLKNLQRSTFNALMTLVTGEKIPLGDTRFGDLMEDYMDALQNCVNTGLAFLPWLKHFAPEKSGFKWIQKASDDANQYIKGYFKEHQSSFVEDSTRDLIDAYLEQIKKEKDPGSSFYGEEGLKQAVGSITSLFFGGGETTATTLTWLIFYLCVDQRVQRKLQEEIDGVIGTEREPSLMDKLSMPYTEAVILETLRKSSLAPFGLIHKLIEDTNFQNYKLPKGTFLIANLYHVHHNRKVWGDPEIFRPERFLDGDKNLRDNVIAFQVGKRQCLGEGFARDAMFLFVTKLFQKFHFDRDANVEEKEYLEPDMGYCLNPKRVPVVAVPRFVQK